MTNDRESVGGAVVVDAQGGLLLDPSNELRFKGPFDDYVTVSLSIRNPTKSRIAFKIKTTAPKRYCVKPNSGVLDPEQSMKVNVLLQPFNYDPNEKNKHKFMVQYLYLNDEEIQMSVNDILTMWKDVNSSRLLDLKLKCIFDYDSSDLTKTTSNTNQAINDTNTSTMSSYQSMNETKQPMIPKSEPVASVSRQATRETIPEPEKVTSSQQQIKKELLTTTTTNATQFVSSTPSTTTSSSSSSTLANNSPAANENLSNELKLVKKENESLKLEVANLKEAEARLRKLALSSASSTKQTQSNSLVDLLQNKLVLVIAVLIAIIFYLLFSR